MIKHIKLTNFQKHRDTEVSFLPGLTTLRGANEAGKSTLLRGIAYALFGAKVLGQPLEDVVTWGEPLNSLKVQLDITIDKVDYRITRSKSGAEVRYDGGSVTGQVETTKFLCSKLGISQDLANYLMVSNQSQIRGALQDGAVATSKLIERLARFDKLDQVIELIQTHLPVGNVKLLEVPLEEEKKREKELQDKAKSKEDLQTLIQRVRELEEQAFSLSTRKEELQDQCRTLRIKVKEEERLVSDITALEKNIALVQGNLKSVEDDLQALQRPDGNAQAITQRIEELTAQVATAEHAQKLFHAYQQVQPLLGDGVADEIAQNNTLQEIKEEVQHLLDKQSNLKAGISQLDSRIVVLEKDLTMGTCTFCGKDFSDVAEVKARNEQTKQKIAAAQKEMQGKKLELEEVRAEVETLSRLIQQCQQRREELLPYKALLEISEWASAAAAWKGEAPQPVDTKATQAEITRLRRQRAAIEEFDRNSVELRKNKELYEERLADLNVEVEKLRSQVSPDDHEQELKKLQGELLQVSQQYEEVHPDLVDACSALDEAKAQAQSLKEQLKYCKERQQTLQEGIKRTAKSNELLKAVRSARPVIADKMWNAVLHTVSSYFSQMRGQPSVVSRTADGFLVDGHSVAGLSGSTLDILGLAIRVALVRTFLPASPFLVLDEPAAACDITRTQAMLGFLATTEFEQIIACSHDEVSESVADNVVKI